MPELRFSQTQEQIIQSRGKNVLVSASAGSGKTSVLVERLARLVLEDHIPLDGILAMTFTNDAAAEMKSRLKIRLQAAGDSDWIREQLALLETASICTIDSFCADILRRYSFHLQIPLAMASALISESQKSEAMDRAFEKALDQIDPAAFARLRIYLQAYKKSDEDLQERMMKLREMAQARPDPAAWISALWQEQPDVQRWFCRWFEEKVQAMLEITGTVIEKLWEEEYAKAARQKEDILALQEKEAALKTALEFIQKQDYPRFREAFLQALRTTRTIGRTYNKHSYALEQGEYKKLEAQISEALFDESVFDADETRLQDLARTLCTLSLSFMDGYQQIKREMEVIDYGDMEHFAYEILKIDVVQEEIRNQYQAILVDEFQDTNDLQEAIIGCIARKNNVFRVGDVKQSIYGFRQARPQIMQNRMKQQDEHSCHLVMAENYRANDNLIAFTNDFFSKLMNTPFLSGQFSEQDLASPGRQEQKMNIQVPVRFLFTQYQPYAAAHGMGGIDAKKLLRRAKADLIARDIKMHHDKGMEHRSMCILTRSHSTHEELQEALEAWNIPVLAEIDHGFYTNQAVQVVLAALQMRLDVMDDIALTAFLCSPLGKVSHAQLADALKDRKTSCSIYTHLKTSTARNMAGEPILQALKDLWRMDDSTIAGLLAQIYNYNDYYYRSTSGQDKTNLDLLLEMAVAEEGTSLHSFLHHLRSEASLDKTGQAAIHGKEENVVKIKTMHHAKGLQYPLVYLYSRTEVRDMEAGQPIRMDADLGLSLAGIDESCHLLRPSRASLAMECKREHDDMEEEIRLLYVACTRAEQELVIVDSIKDLAEYDYPLSVRAMIRNRSYTSWLLHTYYHDLHNPVVFDEKTEVPERPGKKDFRQKWQPLHRYLGPVPVLSSQTASQAKQIPKWKKPVLTQNRAVEHGTLIHNIAENIPYPYTEEDIRAYAARCRQDVSARDVRQLLDLNTNEQYRTWMGCEHTFECSYMVSENGQFTHGFMDLVVFEKDVIHIVDFKTDAVDDTDALASRYRSQLDIYRKAMEKIHPDSIIHTWLYSFHNSALIPVS